MLSREAEERLAEILVQRVEKVNANILEEIGKSLKQISTLNTSQSRQLQQMLKYGADYNKLVRILSKLSGKSVEDIHKIFKTVARTNKEFARDFYDYRNVAFIPYDQDIALKRQVLAMANLTANLYRNITSTSGIGLMVDGEFKQLQVAYTEIIDRAITSVVQGKEDFYKVMRDTLKEVGGNGLVVYDSGRTRRLDSAVRMNILDGIRMVNNETNRLFGEEYGADGVEITVHEYPAPDHADVQGRQFSNEEYEKLQTEGIALTVEGDTIDISIGVHHRPISELNCYHRPMNIVIGISKPQYSKEELQQIKEKNEKGFDFEGKHYTMYEGTQLQRQIETAIRKNKDTQILARASGDKELANKSQIKINKLTKKYNDLSKASGLTEKKERAAVSGYRKIKVEMPKQEIDLKKRPLKDNEVFIPKEENRKLTEYFLGYYENEKYLRTFEQERYDKLKELKKQGYKDEIIKLETIDDCNKLLEKINTRIDGDEIKKSDFRLVAEASKELYEKTIKAPYLLEDLRRNRGVLKAYYSPTTTVADTQFTIIRLNNKYFSDYEKFKQICIDKTELHEYVSGNRYSLWSQVAKGNETKQTIVHEFGHRLHQSVTDQIVFRNSGKTFDYFYDKFGKEEYGRKFIDLDYRKARREITYEPIRRLQKKTGLTQKEIIDRYVSIYGRTNYDEIFAETFAASQLGKSNPLADELIEFLVEIGAWEK